MRLAKKLAVVWLTVCLAALCGCGKLLEQRKHHYFEKGKELYDAGDYNAALKEFSNALILDEEYYDALYWAGMSCYKKEDYKRAFDYLKKTTEIKPDDIPMHMLYIKSGFKSRQYGWVIAGAKNILAIDNNNKDALFYKLKSMITAARKIWIGDARKELEHLIDKGYDDPRIYSLMAEIKIQEGDLVKASSLLDRQSTCEENWLETMRLLAKKYESNYDFTSVIETYRKIIDRSDDKLPVLKELCDILLENKKMEETEGILKETLLLAPDDTELQFKLINCLISLNKSDEAEKIIKRGLKQAPDNKKLKKTLIALYEKKGDLQKTINIANDITASLKKGSPEYLEIKNILADIYYKAANYKKSETISQSILSIQPNNISARFNLCRIAVQESDGPVSLQTIGNLRQLINDDYGKPEYYYYLGIAHSSRKEATMAESALNDALDKAPDYKPALLYLADIYLEKHYYAMLKKRIQNYLKLKPNDQEVLSLLETIQKNGSDSLF